jgi:tripartite-type tricarboxylate transporter receptor subunit TctC
MAGVLAMTALCIAGAPAAAQDWPNRTITMIVPFPPGGGNDTLARIVAAKLSTALGYQVVVDNRGGANGVIGMRAAAKMPPDGHTLLFANSSTTSINPALYANVGYDVKRDFEPIGMFAQMGIGIIAHPSFAPKSVAELIALAKREPGRISIGTSPPGSGSNLSAELFRAETGVNVTLVPYKGAAALTNDLLGGHIPLVFSVLPPALANIRAGTLKLLAVTTPKRLGILPDVPTVSESGMPGYDAVLRYGLLAPAGTPKPIIDRLNMELRALIDAPDVRDRVGKEAGDPISSSPRQYEEEMEREDAKWGALIRKHNLKVN